MKIGTREIGNGQPCYIIAEAGTGYAGEHEMQRCVNAAELVSKASIAGADAVKFQVFVPDEPLFCPMEGDDKRQYRWGKTHMRFDSWKRIKEFSDYVGITFLASAFQPTAVQWLKELNVAAYKVASRAAATYPYDAVPGPFIVSLGMATWEEAQAVFRRDNVTPLQCISAYPTPLGKARWYGPENGCGDRGLSDHSGTIWPGLDAMARGCSLLEVHFAIDKADAGNDRDVCLTVDQLKLLCEARDAFHQMRR